MAETYSVKAVLSAADKGFTSAIKGAGSAVDTLGSKLKSGLGFGILTGIGQKAFDSISSGIGGLINEMNEASAAWKTFQGNMSMNGHSAKEIKKTKSVLQDYATKTIYSASDMATTFAQLDAVGIKSAQDLVTGFGGLAAAAENPQQAMKTLSQQATQMAAKPMVQWQDFKLMLEQTPAGIAAIAKAMGMSTAELVKQVQAGTVKTEDFFNAIKEVGNNDDFSKLATQYKTAGQAMDGLKETLSNKLMPAFNQISSVGIGAIEKITDTISKLDGDAIASAFSVDNLKNALAGLVGAVSVAATAFGGVNILDFLQADAFSNAVSKAETAFGRVKDMPGDTVKSIKNKFSQLRPGKLTNKFANLGVKGSGYMKMLGNNVADSFFKFSVSTGRFDKDAPIVWKAFDKIGSKSGTLSKAFNKVLPAVGKLGGAVTSAGGKMVSGLKSMMGLALKLLAPAVLVGAVLAGMGLLYKQFGSQIDSLLQMVAEKGPQIITNFASGITGQLPSLIAAGAQMLAGLMNAITANIPVLFQAGLNIVQTLVQGVGNSLGTLIPAAINMISALAAGILGALPQLVTMGLNLILSLAQGIVNNLPLLINSATGAIMTFVNGASSALPNILNTAVQIVQALLTGLVQNLPSILSAGIGIIQSLISGIVNNLPTIIASGFEIIGSLIIGIVQMLPSILSAGWEIIKALGQGILEAIPQIITGIIEGIAGLFSDLWSFITGGANDAASSIEEKTQAMSESMSTNTSAATNSVGTDAWRMAGDVNSACNSVNMTGATSSFSTLSSSAGAATGAVVTDTRTMARGASSACSSIDTSDAATQYENLAGSVDSAMSSVNRTSDTGLKNVQSSYDSSFKAVNNTVSSGMNSVASSVQSGGTKAAASAQRAASAIVKAFQQAVPRATAAGGYIGKGLANGMASTLSQVRSVAAQLAAAADAAIRAKAKIASPSKVAHKSGAFIGAGLANGMLSKVNAVTAAAKKLAASALKQLRAKASSSGGNYKSLGEKLSKGYKTSLTKSLNKALKAAKKLIQKRTGKALTGKLYTALSKAMKSGASKAISTAQKAITRVSTAAQEKYDAAIQRRDSFYEKLADMGDIYTVDSYGYLSLKDFDAGTKQINALGKNLNKLKSKLPQGLLNEIADMETANGLAYTNRLLKMSAEELKAYGNSYTKYVGAAEKTSSAFCKSQLSAIRKEFNSSVTRELKSLNARLTAVGKDAMAGFVKGMNSVTKKLKGSSKRLALSVVSVFRKYLKIHSPSRVFAQLGRYVGQGFADGMESTGRMIQRVAAEVISIPAAAPVPVLAGGGKLPADCDYYGSGEYTVIVPVELDGREVARVTAPYTQKELNKLQTRDNRKRGRAGR